MARAELCSDLHEAGIDRQAGKDFELFNPVECLRWCQRHIDLVNNSDKELLKHLCRESEVARFDQRESALTLRVLGATPRCGIYEDVRVEKAINAHGAARESMQPCRPSPLSCCSRLADGGVPCARDSRDVQSLRGSHERAG